MLSSDIERKVMWEIAPFLFNFSKMFYNSNDVRRSV